MYSTSEHIFEINVYYLVISQKCFWCNWISMGAYSKYSGPFFIVKVTQQSSVEIKVLNESRNDNN